MTNLILPIMMNSGHGHSDPKMLVAMWIATSIVTLPSFIYFIYLWYKHKCDPISDIGIVNGILAALFIIINSIGIVISLASLIKDLLY
jgi:hypothetical protein